MARLFNIALILILVCPNFLHANEDPKKAPAHLAPWQKADDKTNGNINRISLAKLKATNTSLISFLKDSCLADSTLHPVWHGEYSADKKAAAVSLSYGIRCNFSQSSNLSIMANDLSPLLRQDRKSVV